MDKEAKQESEAILPMFICATVGLNLLALQALALDVSASDTLPEQVAQEGAMMREAEHAIKNALRRSLKNVRRNLWGIGFAVLRARQRC